MTEPARAWHYRASELFGWLNLLAAGLLLPLQWHWPTLLPVAGQGLAFTLWLQLAVSSALVFAARAARAGRDLGYKTYPATLVAYLLFVLMASRWLGD